MFNAIFIKETCCAAGRKLQQYKTQIDFFLYFDYHKVIIKLKGFDFYALQLHLRRRGAFQRYDCARGGQSSQNLPCHRKAAAHRRKHLHAKHRGSQFPQVRSAHFPHGLKGNLELREPVRRIQSLHKFTGGELQRRAIQSSVQYEHFQQNLAGRDYAGAGSKKNRRAGFRNGGKNSAEP